ncbi:MAG: hypothetical protein AVDCRST_MAG36-2226, partial [uncultured Nocardioidaceae bacterium]
WIDQTWTRSVDRGPAPRSGPGACPGRAWVVCAHGWPDPDPGRHPTTRRRRVPRQGRGRRVLRG